MKKGLTILATMILTFSISTYDVDAKSNVDENTNEIITAEEILEDERMQKEIENYLVKELGENYKSELEQNEKAVSNAQSIEKNFKKNEKGDIIYPDYFGGMYINEDNQLVIQIIQNKIPTSNTEKYSKLTNGYSNTNLVRANLVANSGDSGGIIIDQNAILGSSGYYTAGVETAKSSASGIDILFTKASQVNTIFGLTRY